MYKHYKKQLQIELKGERDSFLREVMPKLITGSLTCALHPLIHTGYGYAMGDDDLLVEGVAYMHHNFIEFNINEDTLPGI